MNLIRKFFGGHTITTDTPMPIPIFDREAHLIDELHSIDERRDELAECMRDFRKRFTLMRDGELCYQCQTVDGRAELDAVWRGLLNSDGKLLEARNQVLHDLARLRCPSGFVQ